MNPKRLIDPPDPPEHVDRERTQYGLNALRKRFIRRASVLAADDTYRRGIRDARQDWNTRYPRYAVYPGKPIGGIGLPPRLEEDVEANTRRFYQMAADCRAYPERADEFRCLGLMWDPEMDAQVEWLLMIEEIAQRFWPPDAFPVPGGAIHLATAFITACLFNEDPRFLDIPSFFDAPTLRVLSLPEPIGGATWCIPVYPGITADDIRKAADRLAQEAEEAYSIHLPVERIRRQRADGETFQKIAERLGLPESTVRAACRP